MNGCPFICFWGWIERRDTVITMMPRMTNGSLELRVDSEDYSS